MTFNDNARIDSSKTRRRGRTGAIAGGGGIVGVIAIFLIAQFTGVDLSGLLGGGGGAPAEEQAIENCETGEQANANIECRLAAAADSIDTYWAAELPPMGVEYTTPEFLLFTASVDTGCGGATSATGPFYCPADQSIYIDTDFYDELANRFGSSGGSLAQIYVLAHEWGHHVQAISGVMDGLDRQDTGPTSDGVRLELQADCFAGAWVGAASTVEDVDGTPFLVEPTDAEIADALSAAAAVGDDRIQESTTGQVNPEAWTHGSSEQRQRWFLAGKTGGPNACETFGAVEL